jgi:hypothetical protein
MSLYHRFKDRFGTAGVVLGVIAIVLAIGGSAFAASGLTAKQKKEVKAIAKSFQGTGPAGAAGTPGTNGTNGKDGAPGTSGENGTPGKDGTSVTTTPIDLLEDCGEQEGVMVHSASGEEPVCSGANGTDGSPWTVDGVLPEGKTETGTWYGTVDASGEGFAQVSFTVPLKENLDGPSTHISTFLAPDSACDTFQGGTPFAGPPVPDPGNLCIYTGFSGVTATASEVKFGLNTGSAGASYTGALIKLTGTAGQTAYGVWAVTAPVAGP